MGRDRRIELDWRADTPAELQAQLGLQHLPVTQVALLDKKSRERWLMAVWLGVHAGALVYPLRVHSSERPDFLLSARGLSLGVECMEVVPEELKRLQAQVREVNSGWLQPVLAPGQRTWDWSNPVLQRLLHGKSGRANGEVEDPDGLWLSVMAWAVAKKRGVMARAGFQRQSRNVLLLHDNWPLPASEDGNGACTPSDPYGESRVQHLRRQLQTEGVFSDWQEVAIVQNAVVWQVDGAGIRALQRA